jgi:glycosyltransferase involved in cell wall biosynthesis
MAFYYEAIYPHKKTRTVLSLHDIGFHKYNQIYKLEPKRTRRFRLWFHSKMLKKWEPYYSQRFSSCITMSDLDKHRLIDQNPLLTVESIPNGIDVQTYQLLSKNLSNTQDLLFIGNMDYRPNQDAMYYFCKDIFPEIKKQNDLINLWIVGKNTSADIFALAAESIFVTGRVDDVRPFYEKTHISVIPLRAGGGTRLKILESMALGRPVISTTIGCEGLQVVDGEHLFIADCPEVFIQRIHQLFDDPQLYSKIVTNARDFVETHYSWDGIVNKLEKYYENLKIQEEMSTTCKTSIRL